MYYLTFYDDNGYLGSCYYRKFIDKWQGELKKDIAIFPFTGSLVDDVLPKFKNLCTGKLYVRVEEN